MKRLIASVILTSLLAFIFPAADVRAQERTSGRAAGSRVAAAPPVMLTLPRREGSVRFMVVGDTGTGSRQQRELADLMVRYRQEFPFEFALLVGDNMYGGEKAADFKRKFEDVYRPLLDSGVKFYASLGNHDESNQRFYEQFNMGGEEYYRVKEGNASFYALNSNYMDRRQLKWFEERISKDDSEWKVAFFHHPPYSSGRAHGSDTKLREVIEPFFLKYGVDVVFAGHDHFYERIRPQKGIHYFVAGAGGKLRRGDVRKGSPLTAAAYDRDMSFMLVEIAKGEMHFQVVSRTGETVDSGIITNGRAAAASSK